MGVNDSKGRPRLSNHYRRLLCRRWHDLNFLYGRHSGGHLNSRHFCDSVLYQLGIAKHCREREPNQILRRKNVPAVNEFFSFLCSWSCPFISPFRSRTSPPVAQTQTLHLLRHPWERPPASPSRVAPRNTQKQLKVYFDGTIIIMLSSCCHLK